LVQRFFTGLGSLPTDVTFGPASAVPEPSSLLLMTGGGLLVGLGLAARRRRGGPPMTIHNGS
jgi:hypothetical protein